MRDFFEETIRLRAALTKAYRFISPLSDSMPITASEMAKEIMSTLDHGLPTAEDVRGILRRDEQK